MFCRKRSFLLALGMSALLLPTQGLCQSGPKLAFAISTPTGKNPCAEVPTDCASYVTEGYSLQEYTVYVVATDIPPQGMAGLDFALTYDPMINVSSVAQCSDNTFADPEWPADKKGIVATWLHDTNCQTDITPVSVLSVYAYQGGKVRFYPNPGGPHIEWIDCNGTSEPLPPDQTGVLALGFLGGCNPCTEPCLYPSVGTLSSETVTIAAEVGDRASQTFTLTNDGPLPFAVDLSTICPEFEVNVYWVQNSPSVVILDPQETVTFEAWYEPVDLNPDTCLVSLGPVGIELIGAPHEDLRPTCWNVRQPAPFNFGQVAVGTTRTWGMTWYMGSKPYQNWIISSECPDIGGYVEYQQSVNGVFPLFNITFTPSYAGHQDCVVAIDGDFNCADVYVTGTGYGQFSVPAAVEFGEVLQVGQYTVPLSVTNNGSVIQITPSFSAWGFGVSPSGPITLPAGGSTELTVSFHPSIPQNYTATLDLGDVEGNTVNVSGTLEEASVSVPGDASSALRAAPAPNPFSRGTTLRFAAPPGVVTLSVFDINGREVWTTRSMSSGSGDQELYWSGKNKAGGNVPAGIYLYRLTQGESVLNGKLIRTAG